MKFRGCVEKKQVVIVLGSFKKRQNYIAQRFKMLHFGIFVAHGISWRRDGSPGPAWRTQYLAEFDLRHRPYDPTRATEQSVTSNTSPDDFLGAASSDIYLCGL